MLADHAPEDDPAPGEAIGACRDAKQAHHRPPPSAILMLFSPARPKQFGGPGEGD